MLTFWVEDIMSKTNRIIPGYYEYPLIFFKFLTLFFKFGRNGFFSIILNLNILTKKQKFLVNALKIILEKKFLNFDFVKDLAKLGPGFVKLGQALSTRPDIFGTHVTNKLIFLQDDLDPFSSDVAINIIEKAVDKIPEDLEDKIKVFVIGILKKAAAKSGNKVDDQLVEALEKALLE